MKKKKQKINLPVYLLEGITTLYLFIIIGIFPLFFRDYYLNIVWSKKSFFQWNTIGLLAVMVLIGIPAYIWKNKQEKGSIHLGRLSATDLFAILFLVTIVISCWLSPERSEAFWGNEGRQLGGMFLLLCVGAYFVVSGSYKTSQVLLWGFVLANLGLWLMIIAQFFGVDVFEMYENLAERQHAVFMGTLGNVNINAGYSGVVVSLMMGFYYMGRGKLSRGCFFGMAILGIYACYCTRSDSWILAVGMAFFAILCLAVKERENMEKWWRLCLAFFCGSAVMKLTEVIAGMLNWETLWIQSLRTSKLLFSMISAPVLLAEAVLLILVFLLIKSPYMDVLKRYGVKWIVVMAVIGVLAVLAYIYPMEDTFGTGRGYIWKRTIRNFTTFLLPQKLFGYGPNCFLQSIEGNYGAEMREVFGAPFLDAHNEMLQFLAVTGIFGMISYMGMQISLLVSCIREKEKSAAAVLGYIGITAYLAQGMVNNPQVFTTPLLFIFLGIVENRLKKVRKK